MGLVGHTDEEGVSVASTATSSFSLGKIGLD